MCELSPEEEEALVQSARPAAAQKAKRPSGVTTGLGLRRKLFLQLERNTWFSSKGRRTFKNKSIPHFKNSRVEHACWIKCHVGENVTIKADYSSRTPRAG